ncbi:hypothetical protein A2U01_0001672 [Trifolium medium]|uniref:Uncharacterized protein n=1 Tax=Trifolium medium TaxID=97028 RepID=A0A392M0V4_9FABA|nr:hypothetical protein [Trifolium medium]
MEDERSLVVPSEASDEVGVADGEAGVNSGEDDGSGYEMEVDVRKKLQQEEGHEAKSVSSKCVQESKEGERFLTCDKSTNFIISQKEILSVPTEYVGYKVSGMRQAVDVTVLAVSKKGEDKVICVCGGSKGVDEGDFVADEVQLALDPPLELVGLEDQSSEPVHDFDPGLGLPTTDPTSFGPQGDEFGMRYSSIAEPKEVLSSHKSKVIKQIPKLRKQKSCSKFNHLGAPKCLQLVEAVREGGAKATRRRMKGGGPMPGVEDSYGAGGKHQVKGKHGDKKSHRSNNQQNQMELPGPTIQRHTPSSGINLISKSENSNVPDSGPHNSDEGREKLVETAKLLGIQKVGFTFEEADGVTLKQLVDQERCDRAKKMEWEQREGDQ